MSQRWNQETRRRCPDLPLLASLFYPGLAPNRFSTSPRPLGLKACQRSETSGQVKKHHSSFELHKLQKAVLVYNLWKMLTPYGPPDKMNISKKCRFRSCPPLRRVLVVWVQKPHPRALAGKKGGIVGRWRRPGDLNQFQPGWNMFFQHTGWCFWGCLSREPNSARFHDIPHLVATSRHLVASEAPLF